MKSLVRIVKDLIPDSVKRPVRDQYRLIRKQVRIAVHLKRIGAENPLLLCGFQKSGNTWTRFVIFNYFNIVLNDAEETLTFEELNEIQSHALEYGTVAPFEPGFPTFYRTHWPYVKVFDLFRVIYLHRNPLDTLISYYYWLRDRVTPFPGFPAEERDRLRDIDYFVLYSADRWIQHYKRTIQKSCAVLTYEAMKEDAYGTFRDLFDVLELDVIPTALRRSVAISSAERIGEMAERTGQHTGMASADKFAEDYNFIRSGETEQYRCELDLCTVRKVQERLCESGIPIEL